MESVIVTLEEDANGDLILPIPDSIMDAANLQIGDTLVFKNQEDGSVIMEKKKKYFAVETISIFKMTYIVEEDNEEYAKDVVTCQHAPEFSQLHLDEIITSSREVDEDEVIRLCDKENDYLQSWSREQKLNLIYRKE